jgi:sensor domain CHASE-containing protein
MMNFESWKPTKQKRKHLDNEITNLTQFEWIKSELKRRIYGHLNLDGIFVISWKRILE